MRDACVTISIEHNLPLFTRYFFLFLIETEMPNSFLNSYFDNSARFFVLSIFFFQYSNVFSIIFCLSPFTFSKMLPFFFCSCNGDLWLDFNLLPINQEFMLFVCNSVLEVRFDCLEVVGLYIFIYDIYYFLLKYCKIIGCPIRCFNFILLVYVCYNHLYRFIY